MAILRTLLVPAALAAALLACSRAPEATPPAAPAPHSASSVAATPAGDPVEGLRLATIVGCNGCHTPTGAGQVFVDIPEMARVVAPNLTERRELYDDAGLAALLRQGKTHDGHRPLGMPIGMYQHLSDEEIRDITAWLRSIPAVANPDLPAGWLSDKVKQSLADGTFPHDDTKPDPGNQAPSMRPTEPLALGRHIAMTSCPECHGRDLNGGGGPDGKPSLIVAKAYTAENFARLMKTGITASGKESASGLMTKVARTRFSALTNDEVRALKQYLDSR